MKMLGAPLRFCPITIGFGFGSALGLLAALAAATGKGGREGDEACFGGSEGRKGGLSALEDFGAVDGDAVGFEAGFGGEVSMGSSRVGRFFHEWPNFILARPDKLDKPGLAVADEVGADDKALLLCCGVVGPLACLVGADVLGFFSSNKLSKPPTVKPPASPSES